MEIDIKYRAATIGPCCNTCKFFEGKNCLKYEFKTKGTAVCEIGFSSLYKGYTYSTQLEIYNQRKLKRSEKKLKNIKQVKTRGNNKKIKKIITEHKYPEGFYTSREWRSLRMKVLILQGRRCCVCGKSPKDGIILHVDHIKPRSKYPELALTENNLQVLCEDCNLGKSNNYEEDWRL